MFIRSSVVLALCFPLHKAKSQVASMMERTLLRQKNRNLDLTSASEQDNVIDPEIGSPGSTAVIEAEVSSTAEITKQNYENQGTCNRYLVEENCSNVLTNYGCCQWKTSGRNKCIPKNHEICGSDGEGVCYGGKCCVFMDVLYHEPLSLVPTEFPNSYLRAPDVTFGFAGNQNFWMFDDFTVPSPSRLGRILFYAYQTGSTATPSTITGVFVKLLKGNSSEYEEIFSSGSVNILESTEFSGWYRTSLSNSTNRPLMKVYADLRLYDPEGIPLLPGETYWFQVSFRGSLASGPWYPVIAAAAGGQVTGNARQVELAGSFGSSLAVRDDSSLVAKGLPFQILGCA